MARCIGKHHGVRSYTWQQRGCPAHLSLDSSAGRTFFGLPRFFPCVKLHISSVNRGSPSASSESSFSTLSYLEFAQRKKVGWEQGKMHSRSLRRSRWSSDPAPSRVLADLQRKDVMAPSRFPITEHASDLPYHVQVRSLATWWNYLEIQHDSTDKISSTRVLSLSLFLPGCTLAKE